MRINEIFYSLQGEGHWSGTPAIFIRFSGCNLRCSFCDTRHQEFRELTPAEILAEIERYQPCRFVVLTGGEPSLQITEEFVDSLVGRGYYVAVETNGTQPLPKNVSWATCSPKFEFCDNAAVRLEHIDELKAIYCGDNQAIDTYTTIPARYRYLQPCDTDDSERNRQLTAGAISYVKAHPDWSLSVQLHKILNIP